MSHSASIPSTPNDRPFITVEEAAAVLGISRTLAYSLAREFLTTRTGLPCVRLGESTNRRTSRRAGTVDARRLGEPERRGVTRPKPRTDRRAVVIGPDTADAIRSVGPLPWVVLIHLCGSPTAGSRSVTASTRTLATDLGLSKDTCARALRTLRSAGLIDVDATRTELGRFGTIRYRLLAPPKVIRTQTITAVGNEPPKAAMAPPTPRPLPAHPGEQLTLLGIDERT